jgi:hypothetical protein
MREGITDLYNNSICTKKILKLTFPNESISLLLLPFQDIL